MKNVFLFLVLFFCVSIGYSQQYPVNQTLGSPTTLVTSRGGFKADSSFILPAYSDTNKANANPYVKNYAGSLIKVGNTIYIRSSDLSQWILVGSGGGTTPDLQQVTDVGSTTTIPITAAAFVAPVFNINSAGYISVLRSDYIVSANRFHQLPNNDGTLALSVNGVFAGTDGSITIPVGTGTVTSISQGYGITNSTNPIIATGTISVDTATLSNKYLRLADTSQMLSSYNTRINSKLNISDTASMLSPYLRKIDTTNKFVNSITRTPGKDSIIFFIGGNRFAIKDSVSGGGVPYTGATQDVDLGAFKISAQSFQVEGTNGLGHIHFKHQNSDATATGQSTVLYANSNGDLKYKNAGNYYSTLKTQQTADRVYTFQNKSYTLADSSDLSAKLNASDTTSLSNRINLKLNISDTTVFQRKSLSSYTIMANNTSATANATAQSFKDTSGVYSGTITWTGTTAPSGATTHTYRLTQVGKCVTLHIALVFATNGAGLTAVQMTLPTGAPTPVQPTGLTGSIFNMYPVSSQIVNSLNQLILGSGIRGYLRNNTAANGFEIYLLFTTAAPGQVGVIAQYWIN